MVFDNPSNEFHTNRKKWRKYIVKFNLYLQVKTRTAFTAEFFTKSFNLSTELPGDLYRIQGLT
jgi:hypothetical protein